jgi:hypothetical protein
MTTKTLSKSDLAQFTGSENWYRHGINRNILYTDGAQHVAEHGEAYWLLDEIAIIQQGCRRRGISSLEARRASQPNRYAYVRRWQRQYRVHQGDRAHGFSAG